MRRCRPSDFCQRCSESEIPFYANKKRRLRRRKRAGRPINEAGKRGEKTRLDPILCGYGTLSACGVRYKKQSQYQRQAGRTASMPLKMFVTCPKRLPPPCWYSAEFEYDVHTDSPRLRGKWLANLQVWRSTKRLTTRGLWSGQDRASSLSFPDRTAANSAVQSETSSLDPCRSRGRSFERKRCCRIRIF